MRENIGLILVKLCSLNGYLDKIVCLFGWDECKYWFDVGGLSNFKRFFKRGHIYFRSTILEHIVFHTPAWEQ